MLIASLAALLAASAGCRDKRKYRSSVAFHAKGARACLGYLRRTLGGQYASTAPAGALLSSYQAKIAAIDKMDRALTYLPEHIEKNQPSRSTRARGGIWYAGTGTMPFLAASMSVWINSAM